MKAPVLFVFVISLSCSPVFTQQVQRVPPPPSAATAPAQARHSTAQSGASASVPPLAALPAFTALNRDGQSVTSASLTRPARWLLVYRNAVCPPCDKVLGQLAASSSPDLKRGAPYVIIVSVKDRDTLERVRAQYPTLSDATWLADPQGSALAALKPQGTPMLYGLHGKQIAWQIAGGLNDLVKVEKLATLWLSGHDADPPK